MKQSTITGSLVGQISSDAHIQIRNASRFEVAKCSISPLKLLVGKAFSDLVVSLIPPRFTLEGDQSGTGSIYMVVKYGDKQNKNKLQKHGHVITLKKRK